MILTQSSRNIGDAFLVGHVVQTKDPVNLWQWNVVYEGRPFNPSFAAKIDIFKEELDKSNAIIPVLDNDMGGGTRALLPYGATDKGAFTTVARSQDQ